MFQAVVMAGGEGSRLRPLTSNLPKPMMPIANRPIMEHIIALLRSCGVRDVHATLHYLADEIESYFSDGSEFDVQMDYAVEDTPLGTAGSVKRLESHLDDTFVIISGDALCDFDLGAAVEFHRKKGSAATLVLTRVIEPLEFGVVVTDDEGRIQRFLEKPSWGEVFSDTVNTGIYVLQPEVFQKIAPGRSVDFSKDVFPQLLADGWPIYGYVADGYWADIGSLEQYRQANHDWLERRVRRYIIPGEQPDPKAEIWLGRGTQIHPRATLEPPVIIGHNVVVGEGAYIGSGCTIGDNCVIEPGAVIERSVIWSNSYIGRGARISGATLCNNVVLKANGSVAEGAVIGDTCLLGEGSSVLAGIKLWPNKVIEAGARVTMSLVWGTKWPGNLFSSLGVSGLANIEVTPEFAAKLGAAFGAFLERGAQVITSRDSHHVSRMTKRALISGLMSVGTSILDLRTMPAPVARHMTVVSGATGGLHVSLSPRDPDQVLIQFFDSDGRHLSRAAERKIEAIFAREDFRRSHRDAVGSLEFLSRTVEYYTEDFLSFIDSAAIQAMSPKIVVDYMHGALCLLMPVVLGRLGIESVSLNAFVDPTRRHAGGPPQSEQVKELADVVAALHANLGVVVNNPGERIWLIDELGTVLAGDELLACLVSLVMRIVGEGCKVAVPVSATSAIEQLAFKYGATVIRTPVDARSLMEAAGREPNLCFAGDDEGGFIFPEFQPVFDAMVSLGRLLDFLGRTGQSLSEIRADLVPVHKQHMSVCCAWEHKGAVMRLLHDMTQGMETEHIDGIKVHLDGTWVLVLPDVEAPLFHVYAEADSEDMALGLVQEWALKVEALQQGL